MTRDSLMIYSFGCVLNLFGSLDSHLLMGVFPKVATTKDTWPALWKWFSWSFQALQKGFRPSKDPDGKPSGKRIAFLSIQRKGFGKFFHSSYLDHHWGSGILLLTAGFASLGIKAPMPPMQLHQQRRGPSIFLVGPRCFHLCEHKDGQGQPQLYPSNLQH